MKNLKILIVEDEILIAELIKSYLEEVGHEVVEIAISYDEALENYHKFNPDLILLDIRLYGNKSGIDFAKHLESMKYKMPIVFLSSQYDLKTLGLALETYPYGYLTKPVNKMSLWTTISTAYQLYESSLSSDEIQLYDGKSNHIINISEIMYAESDHIYIKVVMYNGKEIILRESLKNFLSKLPSEVCIQCHRSYIVNTKQIKEWNSNTLTLVNDYKIPVSRNFREAVTKVLQK